MDVNIIEDEKNRFVFEFLSHDHTVLLLVKDHLKDNEDVKLLTFSVGHPETGKPFFVLETKKNNAKKLFLNSLSEIEKSLQKIQKDFEKKL